MTFTPATASMAAASRILNSFRETKRMSRLVIDHFPAVNGVAGLHPKSSLAPFLFCGTFCSLAHLCRFLFGVVRQDIVDQGLVADVPLFCFVSKILSHLRINADRDELPSYLPKSRAAHAPHRPQLIVRHL